jgi:hypothetical protein
MPSSQLITTHDRHSTLQTHSNSNSNTRDNMYSTCVVYFALLFSEQAHDDECTSLAMMADTCDTWHQCWWLFLLLATCLVPTWHPEHETAETETGAQPAPAASASAHSYPPPPTARPPSASRFRGFALALRPRALIASSLNVTRGALPRVGVRPGPGSGGRGGPAKR